MARRLLALLGALLAALSLTAVTVHAARATSQAHGMLPAHGQSPAVGSSVFTPNLPDPYRPQAGEPAEVFFLQLEGGQPAPGNNVGYKITYMVGGAVQVKDTAISLNYPPQLVYLSDTSNSFTKHDGGTITWSLGPKYPSPYTSAFYVFFTVPPETEPGAGITVTATMKSSDPGFAPASVSVSTVVQTGTVEAEANGPLVPLNPGAGSLLSYEYSLCNEGTVSSGQATLTATLSGGATFAHTMEEAPSWKSVVYRRDLRVMRRPAIDGGECARLWLGVQIPLDTPVGTVITGTATLSIAGDMDPTNNTVTFTDTIRAPNMVLRMNSGLAEGSGPLVAGSEIWLNLGYNVYANTIVPTLRLTDTLPEHTTFLRSWWCEPGPSYTRFPVEQGPGWVAWEFEYLRQDAQVMLCIALKVDEDVPPGAILTNTATVDSVPGYDWVVRDQATTTWQGQFWGHGPNLTTPYSETKWIDSGGGKRAMEDQPRLMVRSSMQNIGDEAAMPVTFTVDYPPDSALIPGSLFVDSPDVSQVITGAVPGQFSVVLSRLDPGERVDFAFEEAVQPVGGLVYTHTFTMTPGQVDANPADNRTVLAPYSGPDLAVTQEIPDLPLQPGKPFRIWLRLYNLQQAFAPHGDSGTAWLTDTLPAGLTLLEASLPPDRQDGQTLTWQWDNLPPSTGEETPSAVGLYLTVTLNGKATSLADLTNLVEAAALVPEAQTGNNRSEMLVQPDFPVAVEDAFEMDAGLILEVIAPGVLGNDLFLDGRQQAVLVAGPAHGALSLAPDGSFSYRPQEGYAGPDSFTYRVEQGGVEGTPAQVRLTVRPGPDEPPPPEDPPSNPVYLPVVYN